MNEHHVRMNAVVKSYIRDGLSKKDAVHAAQEWKKRMDLRRAELAAKNNPNSGGQLPTVQKGGRE